VQAQCKKNAVVHQLLQTTRGQVHWKKEQKQQSGAMVEAEMANVEWTQVGWETSLSTGQGMEESVKERNTANEQSKSTGLCAPTQ
tara:strand:+ start:5131 stop:5385 length:255 start_codon:yes stop_codon:yes gene_type:complete